jgi:equilibrative nucleoside transporter 1/2/3
MDNRTTMDKMRDLFSRHDAEPDYAPLESSITDNEIDEDVRRPVVLVPDPPIEEPFSWFEYSIFLLLGVAMLWAWYVLQPLWRESAANFQIGTCS